MNEENDLLKQTIALLAYFLATLGWILYILSTISCSDDRPNDAWMFEEEIKCFEVLPSIEACMKEVPVYVINPDENFDHCPKLEGFKYTHCYDIIGKAIWLVDTGHNDLSRAYLHEMSHRVNLCENGFPDGYGHNDSFKEILKKAEVNCGY